MESTAGKKKEIFNTTKKMIAIYMAIIFFVGLDRFFKILALAGQSRQFDLIGDVFKFSYKTNSYIAFSLPLTGQALEIFIFLVILVLIWFALYNHRRKEYLGSVSLFFIILGASSNLFDRARYGSVIDYLDLKYFTVFNLADAMIVTGVLLLMIALFKKEAVKPRC